MPLPNELFRGRLKLTLMCTRRFFSHLVQLSIAVCVLLCAHPVFAASRPEAVRGSRIQIVPLFSDFDGDNKLDHATISSEGISKRIRIVFGKSVWSQLSFESNSSEQGRLTSADVDGDGDADLVWIAQSTGEFVTLLGDGRGNFAIRRNSAAEVDVLRALLGEDASHVTDAADDPEPPAVAAGSNIIAARTAVHDPSLQPELFFLSPPARAPCAAFFSAVRQRGPPSRLS
jgi:FG-GAP repeat protein